MLIAVPTTSVADAWVGAGRYVLASSGKKIDGD
jgi:hypothetical protein